jgi:hypothetical protein
VGPVAVDLAAAVAGRVAADPVAAADRAGADRAVAVDLAAAVADQAEAAEVIDIGFSG